MSEECEGSRRGRRDFVRERESVEGAGEGEIL